MKPNAEHNGIISNMGEGIPFRLAENGIGAAHIFSLLTEKLYSNKPWAIIREYCTNAQDANISAKRPDRPILLTLPTHDSLTLKIRDYGNGLDENEIREIFTVLGESTKRLDNTQTGMMGIGCKAGFAYHSDGHFALTSIKNGTKAQYFAQKDKSGLPNLYIIKEEPTTEESGLELSFDIKYNDVDEFRKWGIFYATFANPKPIIENLGNQIVQELTPVLSGENWKIFPSSYGVANLNIVMGNICYPCRDASLLQETKFISYGYGLVINVKMGEVSFSSSREELEYTDRTKRNVKSYIDIVKASVQEEVNKLVKDAPNLFEAVASFRIGKKFCNIDKFTWNGKEYTGCPEFKGIKGKAIEIGYRKKFLVHECQRTNEYGKNIDDSGSFAGWLINKSCKLAKNYQDNTRKNRWKMDRLKSEGFDGVVLFLDEIPAEYGVPKDEVIDWDKVEPLKPISAARAKYSYSDYYIWDSDTNEFDPIDSEELPDGPKVWVPIKVRTGDIFLRGNPNNQGLNTPFEVYGVRKPTDTMGGDWILFQDEAKKHFQYKQYKSLEVVSGLMSDLSCTTGSLNWPILNRIRAANDLKHPKCPDELMLNVVFQDGKWTTTEVTPSPVLEDLPQSVTDDIERFKTFFPFYPLLVSSWKDYSHILKAQAELVNFDPKI